MTDKQTTPGKGAAGDDGPKVLADALLGLSLGALAFIPVSIWSGMDQDKLIPTALIGGALTALLAVVVDRLGPKRRGLEIICTVLLFLNLAAAGVWWGVNHLPVPKPTPETTETPIPAATGTLAYTPTVSVTAETTIPSSTPAPPTIPSPQPEEFPTLTPIRPATPLPTSTPRRSPSSTATLRVGPTLQSPPEGASFSGADTPIILRWHGSGRLAADEYYVVTTLRQHEQQVWPDYQWTKEAQLQLPSYIRIDATGDTFEWYVSIMRKTGTDAKGDPAGTPISSNSAPRHFNWTLGETPTKVITPPG